MNNLTEKNKIILYPILFWILLVLMPSLLIFPNLEIDGGWILIYQLITPFLFIIIYKLIKFESANEKLKFILLGFVIPFIIIYFYFYLEVTNIFKNSRFPF